MKLYEGLFLVEAARAASDWDATEAEVTKILEKHGSTVRSATRYDERKLAYPIQGHRRGAYLLAYFDADPEAIQEIRADLKLSEGVIRNLILRVQGEEVPEVGSLGSTDPIEEPEPSDEEEPEPSDEEEEVAEDETEEEGPPAGEAETEEPARAASPEEEPDSDAEAAPAADDDEAKKE